MRKCLFVYLFKRLDLWNYWSDLLFVLYDSYMMVHGVLQAITLRFNSNLALNNELTIIRNAIVLLLPRVLQK